MKSDLFFREYGSAADRPLIILHGLFGSSKNWHSVATSLSASFHVFALDARNHGKSFHSPRHDIPALADDLSDFIAKNRLANPILLGHSMGGLTVMHLLLHHPRLTDSAVIVDIAPRSYEVDYRAEFRALRTDLSGFRDRREIDAALAGILPDASLRSFLQTSIDRDDSGKFHWLLNVPVLAEARDGKTLVFPAGESTWDGRILFLRGGLSPFITEADLPLIRKFFPRSEIADLPGAGHWLHYTHSEDFLRLTSGFLSGG